MTSGKQARSERQAKIAAAAPKESKIKPLLGIILAVVVIAGIVLAVVLGQRGSDVEVKAFPAGATGAGGGVAVGTAKAGAPTLDIYEDFQCPACKEHEQILGPTVAAMVKNGEVKAVYHMRSFLDSTLRNDSSTRAALGAACAADAGAFKAYHDAVFAQQPQREGEGYTDAVLDKAASTAGIGGDKLTAWKKCVAEKTYADYVAKVEDQSARDGVKGTPAYRINGKDFDLKEQKVASPEDFRTKLLALAGVKASAAPSAPAASATPTASASATK